MTNEWMIAKVINGDQKYGYIEQAKADWREHNSGG